MDEVTEEKLEDVQDIDTAPLEVKIINHPEVKKSDYDDVDDDEYDELGITKEDLEEFENGNTSSK